MTRVERILIPIAMLVLTLVAVVFATAFVYRYMNAHVKLDPPAVWFEDPVYPGVSVHLYNYKTRAYVEVRADKAGARLVNRTGSVYDLRNATEVGMYFEEWGRGCDYYYTAEGVLIEVTGNPEGGLYGGCILRYKYPVDATNLTASFLMKTTDVSPSDGIRGAVLANSTTNHYYMAGIKNNGTGWFFGIYKYTGTVVREPGGPSLPTFVDVSLTGVVTNIWFSITISRVVLPNGTVVLKAWLYNVTGGGRLVAYLERADPAPIPGLDIFGVGVYQIRRKPSAVFQMVGFTNYVYFIIVRGLGYCCHVYVYDSGGVLIGYRHVNETGVVEIELSNSAVANATLRIVCGVYEFTIPLHTLLGGDVYEVYFWFEGPVLRVHTNVLNMSFTGWVRVLNASCTGYIYYIRIGLVNQTYVSRLNATVEQVGGTVVITRPESERLVFTPLPSGWAGNVTMRAELYYGSECYLITPFYYNYSPGVVGILLSDFRVYVAR